MADRWQSKIDAIHRLIDPRSGATDGERAAAKAALERILKNQFGQADGQHRLDEFYASSGTDPHKFSEAIKRAFSGADFARMKRQGISTDGEWTGETFEDAFLKMTRDYMERMIAQVFGVPESILYPGRQTRTETVQVLERLKWGKHSKKETTKGH